MKKDKVLRELGPLITALILLAILFFSPISVFTKFKKQDLRELAVNPKNRTTFVSEAIKSQAFSDTSYLPILGSSELEHIDPFHPSSFFMKNYKGFTPFLAGQPGTQSLTHFFYMNSVEKQLHGRKIIFIISPQWFTPKGIGSSEFSQFVTKGEIYAWLKSAKPSDKATQKLAQRLLKFENFPEDILISNALTSLAKGQRLDAITLTAIKIANQFWTKQDAIFTSLSKFEGQQKEAFKKVKYVSEQLPKTQDFNQLDQAAYRRGKENSSTNQFQIADQVWTKNLSKVFEERKEVMKDVSYLQSPEFLDFQQLLNQFAQNSNDVQFIIPPVNGAWYKYSGLSYEMLQQFSKKIKYQLNAQGFHNIYDMTDKFSDKYYIGDTIHLNDRGWVAVNHKIEEFMKQAPVRNYKIDNTKFLSKNWQINS
ncbi:D-alanyl-lipoteichoic acid biosynthesis protein DltD [Lactococcus garvieae]|uniref:D-alanyl-lipoteichoic acid biosynthesis protein DltD n=1 Tax=Lactococcus garvieae TaxID=1363 RepID=UPI0018D7A913|nr:D-alanyl-lipoteichoic acid biosynthesis protein DltD [Lactococcus garvieae]QPS71742.1 D-alanyl-lipoteichoic acid biosynthesis protein DltD [Lactococcus garvieae]